MILSIGATRSLDHKEKPGRQSQPHQELTELRPLAGQRRRLRKETRRLLSEEEDCQKLEYPPELVNAGLRMIDRLIRFTENRKRRFVLMVDSSHSCLDSIDSIRQAFQQVASAEQAFEKSLRADDYLTTLGFNHSLYTMHANLRAAEVDDAYEYIGSYFDFVRDNIDRRSDSRNYYTNMLKGLTLVRPKLFDFDDDLASPANEPQAFDLTGDEGHPVYLIICLFGPHNPHLGSTGADASFLPPLGRGARDAWLEGGDFQQNADLEQPSVTEKLVKVISEQMVNFMIITPCLDLVKKEKVVQFVQSAKRSLLVDFEAHKHKLKELLSDFIN